MSKIREWFLRAFFPKYVDFDIYLDKWLNYNGNNEVKSYVLYNIKYSSRRDNFKLVTSGYKPKEHQKYAEIKAKVYALNMSNGLLRMAIPAHDDGNDIVITHFPLDTGAEKAFSMEKKDDELIKAMQNYIDKNLKDVEVFEIKSNIVATSDGYYGAFYKKDLKK